MPATSTLTLQRIGGHVPDGLARRKEISQGAKLLYARLLYLAKHRRSDTCTPTMEELGDSIGVTVRMAHFYLDELRHYQLITSRRGAAASVYSFPEHPWTWTTPATQLECSS